MMTLDAIAQLITVLGCGVVIAVAEPALNKITRRTRRGIRLGYLLICAGAVLLASAALIENLTPWTGPASLSAGIALLLFASHRRQIRGDRNGFGQDED
jgi:hypothetical protein